MKKELTFRHTYVARNADISGPEGCVSCAGHGATSTSPWVQADFGEGARSANPFRLGGHILREDAMHAGRHHCDEAPARPAFRHRHGTLHVCAGVDCRKAGSAVRDASARPPSCTGIAVCMFCGTLSARGGRVGLHAESLCIGGCGHHVCGGGLHAGAGHSSAGMRINGRNNGSASCRQGSGWTACHALLPCGMHLHVRLHTSLSMTARSAGMSSPEAF
jgi:hypothetical protein